MSRFTPRYNKNVTMVSFLPKRNTYISAVEGLKDLDHRSKGLKYTVPKKKLTF